MRGGRHPTDAELQRWTETGGPASVERHLADCEACLARAEAATDLDEATRAGLAEAVGGGDVRTRTTEGVRSHLDDEEALSVLADLFGLAWGVAREVLDRSPLGADRSPSPEPDPGEDDDHTASEG